VRLPDEVAPVATSNGHHCNLGEGDGGTDGRRYFLGALDSETDMAIEVTNDDEGLETSPLTGAGLFLYGHDFEYFVLEVLEEGVDDL